MMRLILVKTIIGVQNLIENVQKALVGIDNGDSWYQMKTMCRVYQRGFHDFMYWQSPPNS
jgi:hypothetical protein